jgi:hypothetical protein
MFVHAGRSSLFALSGLLLFPVLASAQTDPYVAWGQARIYEVRQEMHSVMTAQEISLDNSIHYRVLESGVLNAGALRTGGNREILVASALLAAVDNVNTMATVAVLWNSPKCLDEYIEYLGDLYASNSSAIADGLDGKPTKPPFMFMLENPSNCPNVPPSVITNNVRKAGDIRTTAIYESIKFLLLHEFAHQLNNDFDGPTDAASRRAAESLADSFAVTKMLKSPSDNTLAALSMMVFFASLETLGSDESQWDHPTGAHRIKAMLTSVNGTPEWNAMWVRTTQAQHKQFETALAALDKLQ